ncbi:hypothetical protein F5Y11DRAFT_226200 [Daldinia sp. FL1419]|nr:hypothetical protein F5Y11DRAFT_226200 [Daldinia sp. FL1419]
MSNLGALTTAYQPHGTGCSSINLGSTAGMTYLQYGTISSCLPSNFNPDNGYYYSPGVCPSGYTYACTEGVVSGTSLATAATCCPSNFVCGQAWEGDPNRCKSTITTASVFIVDVLTYSSHIPSKIGTTSVRYDAGQAVFAKGPVVWRDANDVEWSMSTSFNLTTTEGMPEMTTSTKTTTSSQALRHSTISTQTTGANPDLHEPGDLTLGAKVGIGLGVSLGVLFIFGAIIIAYIIGKRKGRHNKGLILGTKSAEGIQYPSAPKYELSDQQRVLEMATYSEPVELMSSHSQEHIWT